VISAGTEYDCEANNFANVISSIIVGSDVQVDICKNQNCAVDSVQDASTANGYLESP